MTSEQPAYEPGKKIWTGGRVALAALTFVLLAVALSSSCNPTDSTRGGSKPAPPSPPAPAAKAAPSRAVSSTPTPAAATMPSTLPAELLNAAMTSLDGQTLKLADYKGKVVVVNLWATWCNPCRREIPDFIEMQKDYEGRGLEVIGVTSVDERNTEESIKEFVKEFKVNYKIAKVELEGWTSFLAPGFSIPQTYVIDQEGRLLRKFVGYSPQVAVLVRGLADEALNGATSGGGTH